MLNPIQRDMLERLREKQKPQQIPLELPIERQPWLEEHLPNKNPDREKDGLVNSSYFGMRIYQ